MPVSFVDSVALLEIEASFTLNATSADLGTALDCNTYTKYSLLGATVIEHRSITFNLAYSFEKKYAKTAREEFTFHTAKWSLYETELNRLLEQRKPQGLFYEVDLIVLTK